MMPVLATAEHTRASGPDFISGVVLAYKNIRDIKKVTVEVYKHAK